MSIRESAVVMILQSRLQAYSDMIDIAKTNGFNTDDLEKKFRGRIEELQALIALFSKEDKNDESGIG